jgi:hypothetical protein
MRYAGHRMRWLDVALPVQCLLMPATLLTLGPQRLHMASGVWFAALSAQALAAAVFYLAQARRQRSRQVWPMAALLGVVAVSLLVELIALGWRLDSRVLHVAQLLPALGFLALGLRLVQQYGRAFQTAEQNRAELEVRIREATAQIERPVRGAQRVARGVAGVAVPQPLHQIGPAVPVGRLAGIGLEFARLEIQRAPHRQCHLGVERKAQLMRPHRL